MTAAALASATGSIDTANLMEASADTGLAVQAAVYTSGGYDAIQSTTRRPSGASRITREDNVLQLGRRTKLSATSLDLVRNFTIAGWMIRQHLDYVAQFDFHSRCANSRYLTARYDRDELHRLDEEIERLIEQDSGKSQMDVGRRFTREKMFRVTEAARTVFGDVGLLKLRSGQLQGIESDLIRNPTDTELRSLAGGQGDLAEWVGGVRTRAAGGSAISYAVHRRGRSGTGYELQRIVPAGRLMHYGHFLRFASDQTRGVSPISAAINNLRDVYQGIDLALARMKVAQLFAFAIYSDFPDGAGLFTGNDTGEDNEDGTDRKKYNVDFGQGPIHLELEGSDRAAFLESKTPAIETQKFAQLVIQIAMKALDLPYSFFDESHSNFHGSRGGWLRYERSCKDKRDDQIDLRGDWTRWKLLQFVRDDRLQLPPGMTVREVSTEWVARGMPWWKPSEEVKADKEAVGAGFDNPRRVCKRTGNGDVMDNIRTTIDVIAETRKYAEEKLGDADAFQLDFGAQPAITIQQGATSSDDE